MRTVEVKIHQPAGFDVCVWELPFDEEGNWYEPRTKPEFLGSILCYTKREANRVKKAIENALQTRQS